MKTRRENGKNNGVMDGVTYCDSTEYSSHALTNSMDQTNGNALVLLNRPINGKKSWATN